MRILRLRGDAENGKRICAGYSRTRGDTSHIETGYLEPKTSLHGTNMSKVRTRGFAIVTLRLFCMDFCSSPENSLPLSPNVLTAPFPLLSDEKFMLQARFRRAIGKLVFHQSYPC